MRRLRGSTSAGQDVLLFFADAQPEIVRRIGARGRLRGTVSTYRPESAFSMAVSFGPVAASMQATVTVSAQAALPLAAIGISAAIGGSQTVFSLIGSDIVQVSAGPISPAEFVLVDGDIIQREPA